MWKRLTEACAVLGAATLLSLVWWLTSLALQKLRPLRLLDRLSSRAVLITGCDSGFGHSLARRLDALGVPVFAGCLFPEGLGARSLAADCSSRLHVLPLDVTSDQQVADAVDAVQGALSGAELWALVNNAGTADLGEIAITPLDKYRHVLDVNALGAVRVTKAFLPLLMRSRGRIVNIASPGGFLPVPLISAYSMSKAALISFSETLREEMRASSVDVCTILPTLYLTPIADQEVLKSKYVENVKTIREGCGHTGADDCEKILSGIRTMFGKTDISEMVDEMVAACVGQNVQKRRTPGFINTILVSLTTRIPYWMKELTLDLFIAAAKEMGSPGGSLKNLLRRAKPASNQVRRK